MIFYLGPTLRGSNQKQSLKGYDSQTQSSSSEDVLKQLGRSRARRAFMMDFSFKDSFRLQYRMYYFQRSIEQVAQTSPQANCLALLQLYFQEGRAGELQIHLMLHMTNII